jgi:hypothetical protein
MKICVNNYVLKHVTRMQVDAGWYYMQILPTDHMKKKHCAKKDGEKYKQLKGK